MKRTRTTLEPISAAMFVIVSLHMAAAFGVWWWRQESSARRIDAGESRLAWMYPGDFKSLTPPANVPKTSAAAPKAAKAAKATAVEPKKSDDPPVQKATLVAAPPQQHQMVPVPNESSTPLFASATPAPKPAANRSITLRRAPEKPLATAPFGTPAPPMASPTLLDIARLNTLRTPPPPPAPVEDGTALEEEVNLDAVDEAVNTAFLASWTAPPITAVPAAQREARLNISIGKDGTILKAQMSKFSGSHVLDQSILEAASRVKKISSALPSNFSKDSYDLELNFLLLP